MLLSWTEAYSLTYVSVHISDAGIRLAWLSLPCAAVLHIRILVSANGCGAILPPFRTNNNNTIDLLLTLIGKCPLQFTASFMQLSIFSSCLAREFRGHMQGGRLSHWFRQTIDGRRALSEWPRDGTALHTQ